VADLEVRTERNGARAVLILAGDLDLATVGVLHDAAAAQLASGDVRDLVLDLNGVTFLDSSGLGAMLQLRGDAMAAGGTVTICSAARGAARIIAIAGLSGTFGLPES
jgi:anti-sigma B factor antagonist